jgi:hypothetical protein
MPSSEVVNALSGVTNEATRLSGMESSFAGVNNAKDAEKKFGVSRNLSSVYAPLRGILGGQSARRKRAASFMGGRSSVPGMTNSGADAQENEQLMQLLSSQASGEVSQGNLIAQLLQGSLGARDSFNVNRASTAGGLFSNAASGQMQAEQMDAQNDVGLMDFLGAFLGPAAQIGAAALSPVPRINFGGAAPTEEKK